MYMKGKNLAQNVLHLVISLTLALLFLPLLQSGIDALTGTGMVYAGTTTGSLIDMLSIIVVAIIVFFSVKHFDK